MIGLPWEAVYALAVFALTVLCLLGIGVAIHGVRRRRDLTAHPSRDAASLDTLLENDLRSDDLRGAALFTPHDGPLTPPPDERERS